MSTIERIILTLATFLFLFSSAFSVQYFYKITITNQDDEENQKYKYHLVLVPEELDNDYWRLVEKGAKQAAEDKGVFLEYNGPKQANIDQHLRTLEIASASKVDGIITQGLISEKFTPLINRVSSTGIPVITIDTDAPNSNRVAYIGTDNYYSGFLAGKALAEDTKGNAKVAIITGDLQTNHQKLRVKGFMDAINNEKGITVLTVEESKITRVRASEKAYKVLQEYPEINAFYGTSALDGIGIAQVTEQYINKPYIIGFDTLPETVDYIKKGIINATVVQEPFEMGYGAVEMMVDILEGKPVPSLMHTSTKVLRKDDLTLLKKGAY